MVDEPFIGDDCCQLWKVVHVFADFGRERERVELSLENVYNLVALSNESVEDFLFCLETGA
jgi:hypothetical protein